MGSEFGITRAIGNAYRFVWRERKYLLRQSLLPVGVMMVTDALLFINSDPERTFLQVALWGLPSIALAGWFLFIETRLLMLGERADALPDAPEFVAAQRNSMQASVLAFTLIYMGMIALLSVQRALMDATNQGTTLPTAGDLALSGTSMVIFGVMIWATRYAVAHILAAVDFPVKQYIFRVSGLGISFRLLAMFFLTTLPLLFVYGLILEMIMPPPPPDLPYQVEMTLPAVLLNVAMYFVVISLLNAAAIFALKDILGRRGK